MREGEREKAHEFLNFFLDLIRLLREMDSLDWRNKKQRVSLK